MWVAGYIDTSSILWKVAKITFSFLPSKYWVSHLFVKLGWQATVPVKKYKLGQQVDGIFGWSFFFNYYLIVLHTIVLFWGYFCFVFLHVVIESLAWAQVLFFPSVQYNKWKWTCCSAFFLCSCKDITVFWCGHWSSPNLPTNAWFKKKRKNCR